MNIEPDTTRFEDAHSHPEDRAQQYGIDISLIEANLLRTPLERLLQHDRALASMQALRKATKAYYDQPGRDS